jgi:hypothetical protein
MQILTYLILSETRGDNGDGLGHWVQGSAPAKPIYQLNPDLRGKVTAAIYIDLVIVR